MEEVVEKKKKRKYTRRGTHQLILDGKRYSGSDIRREGKFLILKTAKGSVYVNMDLARVVETVGEPKLTQVPISEQAPGQLTGGIAAFRANRDRQLEQLTAMPQLEDS